MKTKISKAWLGATALFVLGSVPQLAKAQLEYCVATYTDFNVDTAQGEVEAWAWVEDYFNAGDCQVGGGYQWGYFEHSYYASVSIESPTQNTAYHDDGDTVPYGGGSAYASTALSYIGDPGVYDINWLIILACTVGGNFVYHFHQLPFTLTLFEISRHTSASLTENEVDLSILPLASELLWTDDLDGDVSCPILFLRKGSIDVFTVGNGIVNDLQELLQVLDAPGSYARIWCMS